jgi:TRAP-type C4-dicarboxylate transport system permease small subunit
MKSLVSACENIAGGFLLVMVLVAFGQVVFRMMGLDISWTDEVARASMIWMTYIGSVALVAMAQHITITIVLDMLGPKSAMALRVMITGLIGIVLVGLSVLAFQLVMRPTILNQTTPMMQIPLLWIYASLPLSLALMIVALVGTFKSQIKPHHPIAGRE